MSDTPETDEASFDYDANCEYWVDAEFARKLERERDEARKDMQALQDKMYDVLKDLERIRKDIKQAIL